MCKAIVAEELVLLAVAAMLRCVLLVAHVAYWRSFAAGTSKFIQKRVVELQIVHGDGARRLAVQARCWLLFVSFLFLLSFHCCRCWLLLLSCHLCFQRTDFAEPAEAREDHREPSARPTFPFVPLAAGRAALLHN